VQQTDASGQVSFTSIFPACYAGRWSHIHFEVYPSLTAAAAANNKVATSQLVLPKSVCDAVYATNGYTGSASNLSQVSLSTDIVFADGASLELATVTGSVAAGYTAQLEVAIWIPGVQPSSSAAPSARARRASISAPSRCSPRRNRSSSRIARPPSRAPT
jgi:hypothetical protein